MPLVSKGSDRNLFSGRCAVATREKTMTRFDLVNAHCYGLVFWRRWGCWRSRNGLQTSNKGHEVYPGSGPRRENPTPACLLLITTEPVITGVRRCDLAWRCVCESTSREI